MKLRSFVVAAVLMIAAAPSAQALQIVYQATLDGANESPPTGSSGTGQAAVTYDSLAHSLLVQLTFQNLSAPANAGHIHCCTPPGSNTGVAVPFTGLPAALSGSYTNLFDLTSTATYAGAFLTASGGTAASAEAALAVGLASGMAYANLHDAPFPGGDIRGFLQPVPEPETYALLLAGLGLLGAAARRRNARR
jgi:hypothetical protein